MLLQRIRNNLSIILAMAAAMFAAYAFITNLHYQKLAAQYETLEQRNSVLISANEAQSQTIATLTKQRLIDDRIVGMLETQRDLITAQGQSTRNSFKELAKNDKAVADFIESSIVPSSIWRLLYNQAADSNSGEDSTLSPPGSPSPKMPNPTPTSAIPGHERWRFTGLYQPTN